MPETDVWLYAKGPAGKGKSYILRTVRRYLVSRGFTVKVLMPSWILIRRDDLSDCAQTKGGSS